MLAKRRNSVISFLLLLVHVVHRLVVLRLGVHKLLVFVAPDVNFLLDAIRDLLQLRKTLAFAGALFVPLFNLLADFIDLSQDRFGVLDLGELSNERLFFVQRHGRGLHSSADLFDPLVEQSDRVVDGVHLLVKSLSFAVKVSNLFIDAFDFCKDFTLLLVPNLELVELGL